MSTVEVDPSGPLPPYEQIRSQLHDRIRTGALGGGVRLPSIRQLAGDLQVAAGTVARAYAELESAGLIESSRAFGTRVRPGQVLDDEVRRAAARFAGSARAAGIGLADALGVVRAEWDGVGVAAEPT